jgi:hypothetical protein
MTKIFTATNTTQEKVMLIFSKLMQNLRNYMKRKIVLRGKIYATEAGLEPAKEFPSRFLVYRLNRSAIQSELNRAVNITNIYMYAFPIIHHFIRTES